MIFTKGLMSGHSNYKYNSNMKGKVCANLSNMHGPDCLEWEQSLQCLYQSKTMSRKIMLLKTLLLYLCMSASSINILKTPRFADGGTPLSAFATLKNPIAASLSKLSVCLWAAPSMENYREVLSKKMKKDSPSSLPAKTTL